ncbi:MAG: Xaa-Pro peptidase family protein [Actinomycetota bacterium]|nr:Xaa-Pro peptidase family protein [Actinomycetota bacterium]
MTGRPERLAGLLPDAGADLVLISKLVDVRYMTGYTGSNGLAVVGPDTRVFVTDFRYVEQAAAEVDPGYERRRDRGTGDLLDLVAEILPAGELRLGFDDSDLTIRRHARLRERLPERVTLVAAGGLVERLRVVKEPREIELVRTAAQVADTALAEILAQGLIGRTERSVADALESAMRTHGARRPSFDSIVAAGPHGALPHAQPRDVPIAAGQMVTIDWGAEVEGYCSDCTRTVAAGEPTGRARELYELVLGAERAGLEAIRPGVGGREVDAAARTVIQAAGHGEHFGHGLGHGVGLEIHEAPRLSMRSTDTLQESTLVTVEPGVYVPGELGVRIEDLVMVTADGAETLTSIDKELLVTH